MENQDKTIAAASAFADSKPHYELLDGLRGVAALAVLWYHVYEGFQFASGAPTIAWMNHGYLAVDFFFILSGFVISYAYDDRWGKSLDTANFFKRRLIRLHPMVVLGAVVGAVTFVVQGSEQWDGSHVATSAVMLALLCAMFFVPAVPGQAREVRGNGEMFPLNGPAWSLFFEYIGNIVYALAIRRLNTRALAVLTAVLGVALAWFSMGNVSGYGSIGVGWTLDGVNFLGGSLRMLFPFSMGMLVARTFRPRRIRGAFWICAAVLLALLHVPFIAALKPVCMNGVFEMACIAVAFPLLVWLGASGQTTDAASTRVCKFLGDISFPLYITHYPFMYLFYSWLIKNEVYTLSGSWPLAVGVCLWNVAFAYAALKLYDEPVRRWLTKRFLKKK